MTERLPALVPPAPASVVDLAMDDGAVVRLRRHGNPDGPRLALSHGAGLAIEAYFPFWELLLDRYDVILFDCRNHGQNPLFPVFENHSYPQLQRDMETIFDGIAAHFGPRRVAGVFHSMSSVAALGQTLSVGPRWDPLVLVDIPIFPRPGHPLVQMETDAMRGMALLARRRPDRYPDPETMARQIVDHPSFARWVEGSHLLFARSTLRPDPDRGDWVLAAPKEYEAKMYETNVDGSLWEHIGRARVPIGLIGAEPAEGFRSSPGVLTHALAEDRHLDYTLILGTTHFLQIERPRAVVDALEAFLAKHGAAA